MIFRPSFVNFDSDGNVERKMSHMLPSSYMLSMTADYQFRIHRLTGIGTVRDVSGHRYENYMDTVCEKKLAPGEHTQSGMSHVRFRIHIRDQNQNTWYSFSSSG